MMAHLLRAALFFALLVCIGATPAEDRFFDSGGMRLRFVEQGSGAPVVLLHGFTADTDRAWIQTGVAADLARDYRVIALDLRGHGRSDKPCEARAYDRIALDVVRLLDHLGIERAHAVGYSLGGNPRALAGDARRKILTVTLAAAAYLSDAAPRTSRPTTIASRSRRSCARGARCSSPMRRWRRCASPGDSGQRASALAHPAAGARGGDPAPFKIRPMRTGANPEDRQADYLACDSAARASPTVPRPRKGFGRNASDPPDADHPLDVAQRVERCMRSRGYTYRSAR